MTGLPDHLAFMAPRRFEYALDYAATLERQLLVCTYADEMERAKELCHERLTKQIETGDADIYVNGEIGYVETPDFHGTHTIINDRGVRRPATIGHYIHNTTDIECEFEHYIIDEKLNDALDSEPADAAAKAAYRRSRL